MLALAFLIVAGAVIAPSPACAHWSSGTLMDAPMWEADPSLIIPLYLGALAFWLGSRNVWRAAGFGKGVRLAQSGAFWIGWTTLALSLASPLHWLSERLFAAHMIEHEVLLVVAAPLLAYVRPGVAMLWSMPLAWRKTVGAALGSRPIAGPWAALRHPVAATALQAVALWGWHVPSLYAWALHDAVAHRLEHLVFFFTAFAFWSMLFHGRGGLRDERSREAVAIGCLFVTVLHSGLLGALLTLSTTVLYPDQELLAADFGLAPLEDQQIAGIVMWIPMGLVYTGAALYFAGRLLSSSERRSSRSLAQQS